MALEARQECCPVLATCGANNTLCAALLCKHRQLPIAHPARAIKHLLMETAYPEFPFIAHNIRSTKIHLPLNLSRPVLPVTPDCSTLAKQKKNPRPALTGLMHVDLYRCNGAVAANAITNNGTYDTPSAC